ncbi:Hypothetical predicted protein [Pelobates cultripes]|uniref:Uncharacterized protein n=1 Tax=Pelobates cultripes TaxID=61616 RepID=A0AAD1VQ98_PELCU|nr:Hypothetical predicted protein [Pelobates cultripes]
MARKVKAKSKHLSYHSNDQAMPNQMDSPSAITDGALPPCKRATGWAKAEQIMEAACALEDWLDSDRSEEEVSNAPDHAYYNEAGSEAEEPFDLGAQEALTSTALGLVDAPRDAGVGLQDPQGHPLFYPDDLHNPHSAKWEPPSHIASYLALCMCTLLSKEGQNKLRAQCPCPIMPDAACKTPEVDPQISKF